MNQDEFEQTVMQEKREQEFCADPFSDEWFEQFEKNHKELEEAMEVAQ